MLQAMRQTLSIFVFGRWLQVYIRDPKFVLAFTRHRQSLCLSGNVEDCPVEAIEQILIMSRNMRFQTMWYIHDFRIKCQFVPPSVRLFCM